MIGELLTLCLLAIALGLDAFSMSIGLGMQGIRIKYMLITSLLVGFFHMLLPLLGIFIGFYLSTYMGELAITIGGILLILFGLNMLYSSFFGEEESRWMHTTLLGLFLFSISVSIDGFSVGLSLGLFSANTWIAILLFGGFGSILTAIGLVVGRKASAWVGPYSEVIGGVILISFGIKFLF